MRFAFFQHKCAFPAVLLSAQQQPSKSLQHMRTCSGLQFHQSAPWEARTPDLEVNSLTL